MIKMSVSYWNKKEIMIKTKSVEKIKKAQIFVVNTYLNLISLGLPLIITNGYYNITETKAWCYVLSSAGLLFGAIINLLFKRTINKGFTLLDVAFASFGLFYLLSAVLSEYQSDVWLGAESRYQGAVMILLYIMVYFVISRNYEQSPSILVGMLIAFCLVSVIGVLNCFDIDFLRFYNTLAPKYKSSYISTIGNINFYSGYMCLMFPVIICGFGQTKGRLSQVIYTTALIAGSFGMMVTSSESFVIGFVSALMIIPLLIFDDAEKLKKFIVSIIMIISSSQIYLIVYKLSDKKNVEISKLLSLLTSPIIVVSMVLLCVVVYLIIAYKPQLTNTVKIVYITALSSGIAAIAICFIASNSLGVGELDDIFKIDEAWGSYRGGIWKQCIEAYSNFTLKEKLIGIGPEALYRVVTPLEVHGNKNLDQAHNEYLQFLLTTGILGLLSYLSTVIGIIYAVCKKLKSNTLAIGLLAGLIAYWVQATVNIAQPFTTPLMYIFISCIGGMLYNKANEEIPSEKVFNINKVTKRRNFNGTRN